MTTRPVRAASGTRVPWRRSLIASGVAAVLAVPSPAAAQGTAGTCTSSSSFGSTDICQKARDLFAFVVPQIGVAVSGGNPIPGDAGSLGGFGKRALSLRVIGVDGRLPRNSVPLVSLAGASSSDFGAERTVIPLPAIDLGVGLFPGIPLGVTNVGGVDAIVGATYLPSVAHNDFEVTPQNGGLGFSYGLRVGALQESSLVPGISVSWQRRQLPSTDLSYTPTNDSLLVTGTSVKSDAVRIIVGKRIALFGLAAGVGQDRIVAESDMRAVVNEAGLPGGSRQTVELTGLREATTRKTAFVNASFSLLVLRIVGEFGWSSAGTLRETVNTFGGRSANEGYRYGSIGLSARF